MRSTKQVLFFGGIAAQIVVLITSLFFLHNVQHQEETDQEGQWLASEYEMKPSSDEKRFRVPFPHFVKGEGRILPSSGYVEITPPFAGAVSQVHVQVGDFVQEGQPLFKLSDEEYQIALREKLAEKNASLAALKRVQEGPSQLSLQVKEKEVEKAQIMAERSENRCRIFQHLLEKEAVTPCEHEEKQAEHAVLAKELEKILVEYAEMKQSSRPSDVEICRANLEKSDAAAEVIEQKIKQCQAIAPISGRVLQLNLHKGEWVNGQENKKIVLGCDTPLHLKVSIDQAQAWRISPSKSLRAIAVHKSNPQLFFVLDFVSLTPRFEKHKLELTFAFDKARAPIYLEEMLDVYIESAPLDDTSCFDYQFNQLR